MRLLPRPCESSVRPRSTDRYKRRQEARPPPSLRALRDPLRGSGKRRVPAPDIDGTGERVVSELAWQHANELTWLKGPSPMQEMLLIRSRLSTSCSTRGFHCRGSSPRLTRHLLFWLHRGSVGRAMIRTPHIPRLVVAAAVVVGIGVGFWAALLVGPPPFNCPSSGFGGVSACPAVHAMPTFAPWLCALIGAAAAVTTVVGWLATRHSSLDGPS
jgi:hypothetical protein